MSGANQWSVLDVFNESDGSGSVLSIDDAPLPPSPPTNLKRFKTQKNDFPSDAKSQTNPAPVPLNNKLRSKATAANAGLLKLLDPSSDDDAVSTADNTFARCDELFRHTSLIPRAPALHSNARVSSLNALPSAEEHPMAPGSRIGAASLQMLPMRIQMQHPSSSELSDSELHASGMSSSPLRFSESEALYMQAASPVRVRSSVPQRPIAADRVLAVMDNMTVYGFSIDWMLAVNAVCNKMSLDLQIQYCLDRLGFTGQLLPIHHSSWSASSESSEPGSSSDEDSQTSCMSESDSEQCSSEQCSSWGGSWGHMHSSESSSEGTDESESSGCYPNVYQPQPRPAFSHFSSVSSAILLSQKFVLSILHTIPSPVLPTRPMQEAPYDGTVSWCGKRSGPGTFFYNTGTVFKGTWDDDVLDGQGSSWYADGSFYTGGFRNGKREGSGICIYPDGCKFDGTWRDDTRCDGQGACYYSDGCCYIGEFRGGKRDGYGSCTYSDRSSFEGTWRNDFRCDGHGTLNIPGMYSYIGEFRNKKRNGHGTCDYSNGDSFEGTWLNDARCKGRGKHHYDDGSIYTGEFLDRARDGHGV